MKKYLLIAVLAITCFCGIASAEDPYQQLATEISQAGESLGNKKLAIIPFSYADGRTAAKDGSIIAERLTMKMIKLQKFEIIERSVLDKVMAELKLQASGMIDASSAQQLGKVLGVDAIVTGTLVETSNGQIEVNARLIKTETAQAIGASQVALDKNWIGDAATAQAQQPAYQQPAYQQPAYQAAPVRAPAARPAGSYGFFDIIGGGGSKNIDITYGNTTRGVRMEEVGFIPQAPLVLGTLYKEIKIDKLAGSGVGPLGFRVGGFGGGAIGGDFEFSVTQNIVKPQKATGTRNGLTTTFNLPTSDNYLTMTSFGLSGDILIRHLGKNVDPYFGIGLGLSLNRIQLPFAFGFTNSSAFTRPVDDFGIGFMFRIPVGMRIKIDPKTHLVAELRYEMNSVSFSRGSIAGESDRILAQGVRFVLGLGFGL